MNHFRGVNLILGLVAVTALEAVTPIVSVAQEAYLSWPASVAESIGRSMRATGRVGGVFDWLTPGVISAWARLEQLRNGLSEDETRKLVADARAAGDTVDGQPLFSARAREAKIVVRIYEKGGRASWQIPDSVRGLVSSLGQSR